MSPEAGLTLSQTFQVGGTFSAASADRSNSVVASIDLPWGPVIDNGAAVEIGGGGIGMIVVLRDGGDYLRLRAFDGATPAFDNRLGPSALLQDSTSHIDVPRGLLPTSGVHTLTWEVNTVTSALRIWLGDDLLGTSDGPPAGGGGYTATNPPNNWAGGGSGHVVVGGAPNVGGEPSEDWPYGAAGASDLRCYFQQLSTWTPGAADGAAPAPPVGVGFSVGAPV